MNTFWQKLPRPFFCLAPMADVTDAAFRQMIAKYSRAGKVGGGPDVFWTEFVSADGIASDVGRANVLRDLKYSENERPIVAQIFGARPENIFIAAREVAKLGFDGMDINMGCPERNIEKQGAGAALIKNPDLAREIIRAAKAGAGEIPVSVKTRIGYNKDELEEWVGVILEEKPAAITIHARTRKEMSDVPANWDAVKRAVDLAKGSGVVIIGNGDVESLADGRIKAMESGADGVMIGRGVFGKPWFFNERRKDNDIEIEEKMRIMVEHAFLFEELLSGIKNFAVMKKHFKAYVNGFDGARELRVKLMDAENAREVKMVVDEFISDCV